MSYTDQLLQILEHNKSIQLILTRAHELQIPNWYLGAGGITQTVWNVRHGFDPEYGIKDYDLVYYDPHDLSYEGEDETIQKGKKLFKDTAVPIEIKNQARVHLWYKEHFGYDLKPYTSVEDAIRTWPTTATSLGVRYSNNKFQVYAPFGLDDLFQLVVRPNKVQITKETYYSKVERWIKLWPKLKIIPWEQE